MFSFLFSQKHVKNNLSEVIPQLSRIVFLLTCFFMSVTNIMKRSRRLNRTKQISQDIENNQLKSIDQLNLLKQNGQTVTPFTFMLSEQIEEKGTL